MNIIIFLIILGLLVFTHELGHFLAAKKSGIRVDEFGLGFPPRVWGVKRGETIYSINWLPFGGFVKIFGENPDEESTSGPDSGRSMIHKPKHIQAMVLVAGVFFNFLFAWILIALGFATVGIPTAESNFGNNYPLENAALVVTGVLPGSPAEMAGLEVGDKVLKVSNTDGTKVLTEPSAEETRQFIAGSNGKIIMSLIRQPEQSTQEITVEPITGLIAGEPNKFAVGIGLDRAGILKLPLHLAIWEGGRATINLTVATVLGFGQLISELIKGEGNLLAQVTGPVGLVGLVGDASRLGIAYLLSFTALISINLAVLNLVPFPALDGGRLLFLLIEKIKGSPITPKIANAVNLAGFALLLLLMLAVTYKDIVRLVS